MRKRVLLALVLVMALLASTGCNLIVKDEAVERATPVIEVAGQVYTKGEIDDQINSMLNYYAEMYAAYGMPFDVKDEKNIADIRNTVINAYIDEAVLRQKITAGGFDQLTAEEMAEIEARVDEDYQLYYDTVDLFQFSGSELTGEERTKAIEKEMLAQGYPTRDQLLDSEKLMAAQEKLRADVLKDVTVTEEEIAATYETRVNNQKTDYTAFPSMYADAEAAGEVIYYAPAGFRYVKHILIGYAEEDQTKIGELENQIILKNAALKKEGADTDAINAEIAELTAQLDAAKAAADASVQPTVDEVAARIAAGEDFNALIEEYNTDPGMTADSIGYLVCEDSSNWVEAFKNASMALAKVGDVSGAVPSKYGVHFIKYESDVAEGPIALEEVRDAIGEELLTTKQNNYYNDLINQWVAEANAKVYE